MDQDLTAQIQGLITLLQDAEREARDILRTARTHGIAFGLPYAYLDEDIAHVSGRAHHMRLVLQRRQATEQKTRHESE